MADTWILTEDKSHSSSHSYHCTNNSTYYGNSFDILEMINPLDLSEANNISFSFWHRSEGDTYTLNDQIQITDYGDIEFYTYIDSTWSWISLSNLGISNLYYDNNWIKTTIFIESSKLYPINGGNISGQELFTNKAKFRFVWKADPQFQFEGWYIDDLWRPLDTRLPNLTMYAVGQCAKQRLSAIERPCHIAQRGATERQPKRKNQTLFHDHLNIPD